MFTFRMPQTKIRLGFCLPLVLVPFLAHAATTTLTITIVSPPSTAVACGASTAYSLTMPKAGTLVCPITVQPSNWSGTFALTQDSGPQPNAFAIVGNNLVVGASDLTAIGSYSIKITPVP